MTIPSATYYPNEIDTDANQFLVHDALRLQLANDYHPGDTAITVEGDPAVILRWPATGILTLTEQCSDVPLRAISFYYDSVDVVNGIISGLQLYPGFTDNFKAKQITDVTINVTADHHNNIKDALIAIEKFVGVQGTTDTQPLGPTLEGRTNFLRQVVLTPKAWFTANKRIGIVPLQVEFSDLTIRLGSDGTSDPVTVLWSFGDQSTSVVSLISTISVSTEVPAGEDNVYVYDTDDGKIVKTYIEPGIYDVTLTVTNAFGQDVCTFKDYITARVPAPDPAVIKFIGGSGQIVTEGVPNNGPYQVNPRIRSPINTLIEIELPLGPNSATPGKSYGGEMLNSNNQAIDPITTYTWGLSDDLNHPNSHLTKASYGVGGIYDLKLRVDTKLGAYRITTYEDSIDIVENYNMWMWVFADSLNARIYEYGLISQTFKLNTTNTLSVIKNSSFLDNVPQSDIQKREFDRNTFFAPRSVLSSGQSGSTLLGWASGRNVNDPASTEKINMVDYNGFLDTYTSKTPITRPWNWAALNSTSNAYFVLGKTTSAEAPNVAPTNLTRTAVNLTSLVATDLTLTSASFENNAQELANNPSIYDSSGNSIYGDFSVYRTAWKDNTGYLARNDGVGPYFRIRSFYKTEGTISDPFQMIRKLPDIQGTTKVEGEMTNLSQGIYFFNNSGSVSAFSDVTSTWSTGGPGVNSIAYRALQDTTVDGYDSANNTLLLTSDGDHRAYLSFDYSPNAFLKFSSIDNVFSSLGSRPFGQQWLAGIY